MSPRVSLPGADELFRTTSPGGRTEPGARADAATGTTGTAVAEHDAPTGTAPARTRRGRVGERASTGRERHEEKITVYVSAAELVDLERARLTLRAEHGIAVDRGRIVREALSVLLADLDGKAGESILVRRLAGS